METQPLVEPGEQRRREQRLSQQAPQGDPQADDLRKLIDSSASRLAESASGALQRLSESVRGKDVNQLLQEAESFARRQPVAFLGAAAIAGFLAVRFLKSSNQPDYRRP
jgi:hypothetical protein